MTHSMPRRTMLAASSIALVAALASGGVLAQAFPAKPISLVVPFPPGGTTDVLARALAERLGPALGQPVIVENKPGAGATIGADYVAKAKADGHVLLVGAVHHTIATSVYKKLPYDFQKDFAPITTIAMVPNVLVVNVNTATKNVNELVAVLKAKPDQASYGSNGNGTAQHLIGTQFQGMTGTKIAHIPYKGSGPLATDLLGGQILMSFDTITPVLPHIKAGKLRPLAVTTATVDAPPVLLVQPHRHRQVGAQEGQPGEQRVLVGLTAGLDGGERGQVGDDAQAVEERERAAQKRQAAPVRRGEVGGERGGLHGRAPRWQWASL